MPLTVEDFLRRAATSTKRYSRRRRKKFKQLQDDGLVCSGGDSFVDSDPRDLDYHPDDSSSSPVLSNKRRGHRIIWTSDEDDEPPEQPPKKRRRRQKKTQPLSARLLAAAVVTGVNVVGGILLPDTGPWDAQGRRVLQARRPLPFVPDNRAPSPDEQVKTDRRQFVDPRKTAPFKHAHCDFSPRLPVQADGRVTSSCGMKKKPRPITAWKPVDDHTAARMGYSGNVPPRKATPASTKRLVTVPLKLVPVFDSYERPRGRPAHARTEARHGRDAPALPFVPCTKLSPPRQRAPARVLHFKENSSLFVPNSSPADPMPTYKSPSPSPGFASVSDDHARTHIDQRGSASAEDAGAQSRVDVETDGYDGQDAARSQLELGPSPDNLNPEAPLLQASLVARVPDTSQAITLTRSAPRRPLKSLVSMLDNFRTIARSATQKHPMATQSRSRPHTAKSITPPSNQQARPVSALPSDDSFSLRRLRERVTGAASIWSGRAD